MFMLHEERPTSIMFEFGSTAQIGPRLLVAAINYQQHAGHIGTAVDGD
jgi:hypothetical protein